MKFLKDIRSKPKILVILGVVIVLVVSLVLLIPKISKDNTGNTDKISDTNSTSNTDTNSDVSELITSEAAQELIAEVDCDEAYENGEIVCKEFASFSGQYVEDGRDELVENVAAILVSNRSDQFLDFASLQYDINGKTAIFTVSGLPAGKSAWVMEKNKMVINGDETFTYQGSMTAFRNETNLSTDKIGVSNVGNSMSVVNTSSETLKDVCVYYKVKHSDGNYFGGICYVVNFGDLKANETVTKVAGHFDESTAEIVRIGWSSAK